MRTTESPTSLTASRRPSRLASALRTRPVRAGAVALLSAGLAIGATGTAAAQGVHAAAQAQVSYRTSGNLVATPWFENRIWPWGASHVTRQYLSYAPQGRMVARVSNSGGHVKIGDWPGVVRSTVRGAKYTASVKVAAANWQSFNRPLNFVIREHDASGRLVAQSTSAVRLHYYFRTMTVSLTAARTGDIITIYAWQGWVLPLSTFFMDDVTFRSSTPVTTPPPPPPPPPPGNAPSTLGLLAYDTGQPTALGDTSKYAYVVVQENQFAHIADIKRMNPNTKVLAYMQTGSTHFYSSCADTTSPHIYGDSFGVSYCWANRFHPDWFLMDRSGNRLHSTDYTFQMTMDVGNPAFAATWAQGTYANIVKDGFDGVWMDDVNVNPGHGLNGRIAKYTDEQYGAATVRFASLIGDYFRSHGKTVIANVGMNPWVPYQLSDTLLLGRHLTAVNREHYVRYGDICGPYGERFNTTAQYGTPPLSSFMTYSAQLQAQGTKITGVDYGYTNSTSDDLTTMTYGRALFLLSWDGTAGSAYFFRRCGVVDTDAPQWTASLGLPTGRVVTDSDGIMTRTFQHGQVVLNPNRSGGAARVSVTAGLHTVSGATEDGGVYVAPQTAAILSS